MRLFCDGNETRFEKVRGVVDGDDDGNFGISHDEKYNRDNYSITYTNIV